MLGNRNLAPTADGQVDIEAVPGPPPQPETLASLYDAHAHALFSLACLLLDDREEAVSAVTQVLLHWSDRRRAGPDSSTRRNLARCVHLRCTRTRLGPHPVPHGMPVGRAPRARHEAASVTGVHALSDQQRAAIALSMFGDHSYEDVADVMSLPSEVISALLRSGLVRLRAAQRETG